MILIPVTFTHVSGEPPAGVIRRDASVALGSNVACNPTGCEREAEITITVNPTLLPTATSSGVLRIISPNATGPPIELRIDVDADFEVSVPGTSRAY